MEQNVIDFIYSKCIEAYIDDNDDMMLLKIPKDIYPKAKELFKQQIIDAWEDGYSCGKYQEGDGVEFYNKTYNAEI
jgi:hypothetical protein